MNSQPLKHNTADREDFEAWYENDLSKIHYGQTKNGLWLAWQGAIQHCMQGEPIAHLRSYSEDANNEDGRLEGFEVCSSHDIGSFPVFTHSNTEIAKIPEGYVLVPIEVIDSFPELNENNYGPDEVSKLNNWGIEICKYAVTGDIKSV